MQPLTLDDLLPLEEFASQRREFLQAHIRYLDRCRRVRIGPRLSLVFENRQTLWFRVQDILRVARLAEPAHVQQELELYNRLLPDRDSLQAALLISVEDESKLAAELTPFRELTGNDLVIQLGSDRFPSELVTCRPEDRCTGTAHWVRFAIDSTARRLLADRKVPVQFSVSLPDYRHESASLGEEMRQSLLEDLRSEPAT